MCNLHTLNGLQTATLNLWICLDHVTLLPLGPGPHSSSSKAHRTFVSQASSTHSLNDGCGLLRSFWQLAAVRHEHVT